MPDRPAVPPGPLARLLDIRPKDLTRAEKDALVQVALAAKTMLSAYIDASVSDEEGLLEAIDEREWSAMWHRVDDSARVLGQALARLDNEAVQ